MRLARSNDRPTGESAGRAGTGLDRNKIKMEAEISNEIRGREDLRTREELMFFH